MADETPVSAPDVVKPKRVAATVFDMVRSLGLLAVIVALTLIFVPGLLHPSKSQRFQAVTYSDYVHGFRQVTGTDALVPTGLASGWYANSARLTDSAKHAHLYIGWVTPDSKYLALDESNGSAPALVATVLGAKVVKTDGQVQIGGATWQRYAGTGGDNAIARTIGGVTVVITGSGSSTQQSELAEALHPSPGSTS